MYFRIEQCLFAVLLSSLMAFGAGCGNNPEPGPDAGPVMWPDAGPGVDAGDAGNDKSWWGCLPPDDSQQDSAQDDRTDEWLSYCYYPNTGVENSVPVSGWSPETGALLNFKQYGRWNPDPAGTAYYVIELVGPERARINAGGLYVDCRAKVAAGTYSVRYVDLFRQQEICHLPEVELSDKSFSFLMVGNHPEKGPAITLVPINYTSIDPPEGQNLFTVINANIGDSDDLSFGAWFYPPGTTRGEIIAGEAGAPTFWLDTLVPWRGTLTGGVPFHSSIITMLAPGKTPTDPNALLDISDLDVVDDPSSYYSVMIFFCDVDPTTDLGASFCNINVPFQLGMFSSYTMYLPCMRDPSMTICEW
jgi:hypothetical protein